MADKLEIERVNSFHHQAIKDLSKDFKIVAVAPDGVIEAIEYKHKDTFILGVQFHPEMMYDKSTFARTIFKQFLHICIENKPASVLLKEDISMDENEDEIE